jgi:hypothetical protein
MWGLFPARKIERTSQVDPEFRIWLAPEGSHLQPAANQMLYDTAPFYNGTVMIVSAIGHNGARNWKFADFAL